MVSVTYFPQRMIILEEDCRNIDGAYGGYLATLRKIARGCNNEAPKFLHEKSVTSKAILIAFSSIVHE